MALKTWTERWRELHEGGLSTEQALLVYQLLDDCRAFGSERVAESALHQLLEVFEEGR